jgi:ABC-2 type transport system permease protein
VLASALTKNQVVAAVMAFAGIALLFFTGFLIHFTTNPELEDTVNYVSALNHLRLFSSGTFDSRPVVFYVSAIALFLFLTERSLAARKLKT